MVKINSWGRLEQAEHDVRFLTDRNQVLTQLKNTTNGIAYGMGRSYGDVCLNSNGISWQTRGLNRFIAFDQQTGKLRCESGLLLRDIQRLMIPRGWILPVTPGTQIVTVGGAIANDVHGKNHHRLGSFGDHVTHITLIRTDGNIIECGPQTNPDWFAATVGGLGLTGIITEVEIQLRPIQSAWLDTENLTYQNLDEFFQLADSSETDWEHTVSWIDCINKGGGRGIFMRGNPNAANQAEPKNRENTMPLVPPISMVNHLTLRPFNIFYFNLNRLQAGKSIAHYEKFFYPLDNLLEWNRMYGPKGFYQYQSVVPRDIGQDAVQAMLKEISKLGEGSFLAVLKTFGNREPVGMLSFPRAGVTLALDFPNKGKKTLALLQKLDAIVREAKGRIYPAKDARMPRDLFESGYPRLTEFLNYRDKGISSALSKRLIGTHHV